MKGLVINMKTFAKIENLLEIIVFVPGIILGIYTMIMGGSVVFGLRDMSEVFNSIAIMSIGALISTLGIELLAERIYRHLNHEEDED